MTQPLATNPSRDPLRPAIPPDPAIRSRTLSDQVHDILLARLVGGELESGAFLREEELSRELEVSRTPVREALSRLAAAGFLERMPHRGYRVPPEDFTGLGEAYPIIATLELLAGRLAFPRASVDDVAALRALNRELAAAVRAGEAEQALERNDRFHDYIARLAGNTRLTAVLRDLRAPLRRLELWFYSSRENGERSVREHDAVIEALATGDHAAALDIFEHNMALTQTALEEERARR